MRSYLRRFRGIERPLADFDFRDDRFDGARFFVRVCRFAAVVANRFGCLIFVCRVLVTARVTKVASCCR